MSLLLLPLGLDRETQIFAALVALATAGVVVAFGALVLFRREGHRPDEAPALDDRLEQERPGP